MSPRDSRSVKSRPNHILGYSRWAHELLQAMTKSPGDEQFFRRVLPTVKWASGISTGSTPVTDVTQQHIHDRHQIIASFYTYHLGGNRPESAKPAIATTWKLLELLSSENRQIAALSRRAFSNAVHDIRVEQKTAGAIAHGPTARKSPDARQSRPSVFVVHGHDSTTRSAVSRTVKRAGFDVVLLDQKASRSKTIIEKLESHSDVSFAVVLLTPDDRGRAARSRKGLKPRARQNVVLELGYFIGHLGRKRVCTLYHEGVELPSDWNGVVYIPIDKAGAWRSKLREELKATNLL